MRRSDLAGGHPSIPDVSIVIVSWNVRPLLEQCLSTLLSGKATGEHSYEVIVIDNASHDGSADLAAKYNGVRVVRSARNLGYARANNVGLRIARGQHLLILNPDTRPCEGSIERLVAFQGTNAHAGIVSPRLLNADGSIQEAAFRFPTLPMAALDLFPLPPLLPGRLRQKVYSSKLNGRYLEVPGQKKPYKIDHPLGACMLLSREAYEEAGGFDARIFMYSEEIDLALRYKQAGWECWQVPQAEVVHLGGQSTSQVPDRMYVELWRSRLYVYKKHYPLAARLALKVVVVLGQVWATIGVLLRLALRREKRSSARQVLSRAAQVISLVLQS